VGTAFLGAIEGVAESTVSILKLFSGWLSDRLGKRKVFILIGYVLATFSRPLIAISTSGWQVLGIRFSDRFGKGLRGSPRDAMIADSCSSAERGKCFGFQRTMDHGGAIVGPLIASLLLLLLSHNYRSVFLLSAVPGLVSLLAVILGVIEKKPLAMPLQKPQLNLSLFDKRFKIFLLIIILFTLGNSSDAFLILRAGQLGVAPYLISILWAVLHLVKMISSLTAGIISDRKGRRMVIISGWLIYTLVYLGFAFASNSVQAWILFALYGLYFGFTEGVERAFVADLVPVEFWGTAYGAYHFAIGIAALPASLLMGFLWQIFGPAFAFSVGAALAFLASIFLGLLGLVKERK